MERGAVGLSRVDGDVEVLPLAVLEGLQVVVRGVAVLGPGYVEGHHAPVPPADRGLGHLDRLMQMAHGGADCPDGETRAGTALIESLQDGLDGVVECEAALGVQLGGEADLGVHHAVGRQILGALACHPHDRVRGLHHPDGVGRTSRGTASSPCGWRRAASMLRVCSGSVVGRSP